MKYWLMKTEPDVFSMDDLKQAGREPWDGIRNYQARNFMRDDMSIGDRVLIYHSRAKPLGIVGEAEVASEPYPDPTQFDASGKYYDPKSKPEDPRWVLVDVAYLRHFPKMATLDVLKTLPGLEDMMVTKRGMRLSIQPVKQSEYEVIQAWVEG